jgi:hypothetical protein
MEMTSPGRDCETSLVEHQPSKGTPSTRAASLSRASYARSETSCAVWTFRYGREAQVHASEEARQDRHAPSI